MFTDVRPAEGGTALLLAANLFCLFALAARRRSAARANRKEKRRSRSGRSARRVDFGW
jgi:hypothetical protein